MDNQMKNVKMLLRTTRSIIANNPSFGLILVQMEKHQQHKIMLKNMLDKLNYLLLLLELLNHLRLILRQRQQQKLAKL